MQTMANPKIRYSTCFVPDCTTGYKKNRGKNLITGKKNQSTFKAPKVCKILI